jgi:hypothetical protein
MNKALVVFALSFVSCLAMPAYAQQNRAKLDAPGNVPFGSSYEQASGVLGKDAEPYEPDPPQPRMKALSCDKCAPLPNVEGLTMYFQDGGGLVRLEAFAIAGGFKTVDECQKADKDMMPKLVELYGKPDMNTNSKEGAGSKRIATFKFADGALVQHVSTISAPGRTCTYTVAYKSKAASR